MSLQRPTHPPTEEPAYLALVGPVISVVFIGFLIVGFAMPVLPLHVHVRSGLGLWPGRGNPYRQGYRLGGIGDVCRHRALDGRTNCTGALTQSFTASGISSAVHATVKHTGTLFAASAVNVQQRRNP